MTQANAVRSSRKHRSSNDNTRLQCTQRQRSEGMREAPYYHATLGTDSLRCVAKRANSTLGATDLQQRRPDRLAILAALLF